MHSNRLFKLLLLVVALVAVAHASFLDNIRSKGDVMVKRQNTGGENSAGDSSGNAPASTGGDSSAESTAGKDDAKPTPTGENNGGNNNQPTSSTAAPQSTSAQKQSTSEQVQQTSSQAQSTSSTSTSAVVEQTSSEQPSQTSSSAQAQSTSSAPQEQKTTASAVVSTKVEVVTKTNEDGSKETSTSTTLSTSTPALNASNDDSDGGMSTSTRNTIIGVVVGVGGAILLGAIALVSWRIWGRRKRAEENDALMDYDHGRPYNNVGGEKTTEPPSTAGGSTAPSRSPFQQTLENYHQPTQVNASSNF